MNNNHSSIESKTSNVTLVDFRKILGRMLSYWWLFVLGLLIAVGASRMYLRYVNNEYTARLTLLVKGTGGDSGGVSGQSILFAEGALSSGGKSLDNEIQILKSLTLIEKVIQRLGFNVSYFRRGTIKESEIYLESPIFLESYSFEEGYSFADFHIELQDYSTFLLKDSEDSVTGTAHRFGIPFEKEFGKFLITLNPEKAIVPGDYRISVGSMEYAARDYQGKLSIQRVGSQLASSILELQLRDQVPEKISQFLNTLIEVYNHDEINEENTVLRNTLSFIDNRVNILINELDSVEGNIQQFKSVNEILGNDAAASLNYVLGEMRQSINQVSEIDIQNDLLLSIEGLLLSDVTEYSLIPTNLVTSSPSLTDLVNQYNELILSYKKISLTATPQNPARIALVRQLDDIKEVMLESIRNIKRDLQVPMKQIENNITDLRKSMGRVPRLEKKLLEKMRMQAVKENLFLFLLQKREETALSEAVQEAKTRVIDRARTPAYAIYPQSKLITMASVGLGLFVPFLGVLIIGLFANKIENESDVEYYTSIPILGSIGLEKGADHIVVKEGKRSVINEMFRLLRTKLNYINLGKKQQIMMVTSSISGEGKTFVGLNLGVTLALSNKKVVVVGCDMRKPRLGLYLKGDMSKGISNYLVGQYTIDDILQTYQPSPNLSFITSGTIPPNPGELLLSDKMESLVSELKTRFDCIIFDTPPIGLVSDAFLLRKYTDTVLLIVKSKVTKRIMIKKLEELRANGEIENASIIINGVKKNKGYYGYGSSSSGYYED